MAGTYSERFCLSLGTAGDQPQPRSNSFTVPAGRRAVIKCVSAYNDGSVAGGVGLFLTGHPVWYSPVPALGGVTVSGLMIVAYESEMFWQSVTLHVNGTVSGYLLRDEGPPAARARRVTVERTDLG